jgi:hypothetical protein
MVSNGHFLKLDNLNKEIFMLSTKSQEKIDFTRDSDILKMNVQIIPNIISRITSKVILPESSVSMY